MCPVEGSNQITVTMWRAGYANVEFGLQEIRLAGRCMPWTVPFHWRAERLDPSRTFAPALPNPLTSTL